MAEVFGLVASIVQIAGAGAQLSSTLYNFTSSAIRADQDITDIAGDVELTSSALESVGKVFETEDARAIISKKAIRDANSIIKRCEDVFKDITELIEKRRKVGKDGNKSLGVMGKLSWPMKEQRVELNRRRLESLKSSLVLLLHVLQLAQGQGRGQLEQNALDQEREKIRELHQQQQDSLKCLQALELRLSKASLDDAETLRGSSTSSRVPTLEHMLNTQTSTASPTTLPRHEPQQNALTINLSVLDDSDSSDSEAIMSDGDDEQLDAEELAKCAKHVQRLLKRIMMLQRSFDNSRNTSKQGKKRMQKMYRRFCHKWESDLIVPRPLASPDSSLYTPMMASCEPVDIDNATMQFQHPNMDSDLILAAYDRMQRNSTPKRGHTKPLEEQLQRVETLPKGQAANEAQLGNYAQPSSYVPASQAQAEQQQQQMPASQRSANLLQYSESMAMIMAPSARVHEQSPAILEASSADARRNNGMQNMAQGQSHPPPQMPQPEMDLATAVNLDDISQHRRHSWNQIFFENIDIPVTENPASSGSYIMPNNHDRERSLDGAQSNSRSGRSECSPFSGHRSVMSLHDSEIPLMMFTDDSKQQTPCYLPQGSPNIDYDVIDSDPNLEPPARGGQEGPETPKHGAHSLQVDDLVNKTGKLQAQQGYASMPWNEAHSHSPGYSCSSGYASPTNGLGEYDDSAIYDASEEVRTRADPFARGYVAMLGLHPSNGLSPDSLNLGLQPSPPPPLPPLTIQRKALVAPPARKRRCSSFLNLEDQGVSRRVRRKYSRPRKGVDVQDTEDTDVLEAEPVSKVGLRSQEPVEAGSRSNDTGQDIVDILLNEWTIPVY